MSCHITIISDMSRQARSWQLRSRLVWSLFFMFLPITLCRCHARVANTRFVFVVEATWVWNFFTLSLKASVAGVSEEPASSESFGCSMEHEDAGETYPSAGPSGDAHRCAEEEEEEEERTKEETVSDIHAEDQRGVARHDVNVQTVDATSTRAECPVKRVPDSRFLEDTLGANASASGSPVGHAPASKHDEGSPGGSVSVSPIGHALDNRHLEDSLRAGLSGSPVGRVPATRHFEDSLGRSASVSPIGHAPDSRHFEDSLRASASGSPVGHAPAIRHFEDSLGRSASVSPIGHAPDSRHHEDSLRAGACGSPVGHAPATRHFEDSLGRSASVSPIGHAPDSRHLEDSLRAGDSVDGEMSVSPRARGSVHFARERRGAGTFSLPPPLLFTCEDQRWYADAVHPLELLEPLEAGYPVDAPADVHFAREPDERGTPDSTDAPESARRRQSAERAGCFRSAPLRPVTGRLHAEDGSVETPLFGSSQRSVLGVALPFFCA